MATISTIQSSDQITNSRTVINTNFDNLNSDKIETSVIDTDTALAANSDAKIPSQKAVKTYIDTSGGANASTTVRGIVEEATQSEVDAGTATGGTGARLFVSPSTPFNVGGFGDGSDGDVTISSPTTLVRDMFYNSLVVTSTLTTDGYRIFVKGTISGSGTIDWGTPNPGANGTAGAGSDSTPAAGGTQSGSGVLKNVAGVSGAAGRSTAGSQNTGNSGTNGTAQTACIGVAGVAGGTGGLGEVGDTNGAAGAGGTITAPIQEFGQISFLTNLMVDLKADLTFARLTPGGSSGSGGGGADSDGGNGSGGGGGSGASGGIVFIAARIWSGTFTIKAIGAAGGNGAAGSGGLTGGGGGGGGGVGGVAVVIYGTKTWSGSYNLAGGAGGTGGAAGGGAGSTAGTAGTTGTTGVSYEIPVTSLV